MDTYRTESTALGEKVTKLEETVADLTTKLGNTQDHSQGKRPPVPGGNGQVKTTF